MRSGQAIPALPLGSGQAGGMGPAAAYCARRLFTPGLIQQHPCAHGADARQLARKSPPKLRRKAADSPGFTFLKGVSLIPRAGSGLAAVGAFSAGHAGCGRVTKPTPKGSSFQSSAGK